MSWRYEDYGTGNLLVSGNYRIWQSFPAPLSQSKFEYGFWNFSSYFQFPATNEIWLKFDVFADNNFIISSTGNEYKLNIDVLNNEISIECWYDYDGIEEYNSYDSDYGTYTWDTNVIHTCLFHLKSGVDYQGLAELWIDGEKVIKLFAGFYDGANFSTLDLSRDTSINSGDTYVFSNVIISDREIGLDEDCPKHIPFEILCDTRRYVTKMWNGNVWRYENYGTADLLSVAGTTVTDLDKSQAVYKTAFYQPTRAKCFDIPATKEIWIRCDINVVANVYSSRIRIYHEDSNGKVCGWSTSGNGITADCYYWINNTGYNVGYRIARNDEGAGKQPFLLHMKSGVTDGFFESYFFSKSGTTYKSFTGNVNNGDDFDNVYIQMDGSNIFVSDLIISNSEIEITEHTKYFCDVFCDLKRSLTLPINLFLDTVRSLFNPCTLNIDTCRNVRNIITVDADTLRNVQRSFVLDFDFVRTLPHKVALSARDEHGAIIVTLPDNSDLQNFEVQISEQQLTDLVTYTTINPVEILEQVKGQYLDYKFNMRIESIYEQGILKTCNCCSDIDETLYSQIYYKIHSDFKQYEIDRARKKIKRINWENGSSWSQSASGVEIQVDSDSVIEGAFLSSHLQKIAAAIGKEFVAYDRESGELTPITEEMDDDIREHLTFQFDDFISSAEIKQERVTYQDLLGDLVGWTSRLPQMLINVFIRDNRLYAIQRGYERNTINLDNVKHTLPTKNFQLMRTTWSSSPDEKFSIQKHIPESIDWEAPPKLSEDGKTLYSYRHVSNDIFILEETVTNNDDGSRVVVNYNYSISPPYELTSEITRTIDAEGNVDVSKVYHSSLTPSQRHSKRVDEDGNEESSVVGSHVAGMYNARKVLRGAYDLSGTADIEGNPLIDTSFPVLDDSKLLELTNAIKWLNRKTQETLKLDIFDYPHVIDFNDLLLLDGKTYHLQSNTAMKTPRIVNKQTLSLVRWY